MMSPYTSRIFLDARGLSVPRISPIGHGLVGGLLGVCGGNVCEVSGEGVFGTSKMDGVGDGVLGGICDPSD